MPLAVALGMLWSTLALRNRVLSGPPLFLLFPKIQTPERWLSKSRSMLPRPWHRVGKEARLGEVCRAVPLNS